MKRRGFTWIELVVVLAIVLIIAAILFPIFARPKVGDRRTPCSSNLRQVGLAIKQYTQDNNEFFPMVKGAGSSYGWADAIQPYMKSVQLLQCQSEPTRPMRADGPATPNYSDYFYNSRLDGQNGSALPYISNTVMLGDAVTGDARQHSTGGTAKIPGAASLVNRASTPIGAAMRHLDGAYYGFADGHIKWYKGSDANTSPQIKNAASGAHSHSVGFAIK